jgi:hypothetical protein
MVARLYLLHLQNTPFAYPSKYRELDKKPDKKLSGFFILILFLTRESHFLLNCQVQHKFVDALLATILQ